jgi:hypothetical protein
VGVFDAGREAERAMSDSGLRPGGRLSSEFKVVISGLLLAFALWRSSPPARRRSRAQREAASRIGGPCSPIAMCPSAAP